MIIKRAPKLILKVIEGTALPKGTEIKISPLGVENLESQRKVWIRKRMALANNEEEKVPGDLIKVDFWTYFGSYNLNDVS